MAKKTIDSAREYEIKAKELFEQVKRMQNDLSSALQSVKRAESELVDREKKAEKERIERERAERLREVLSGEGNFAFHSGSDETEVQPEPKPAEKPAASAEAAEAGGAAAAEPAAAAPQPPQRPGAYPAPVAG